MNKPVITFSGPPKKDHPLSVEQLYLQAPRPIDQIIDDLKNRLDWDLKIPSNILFRQPVEMANARDSKLEREMAIGNLKHTLSMLNDNDQEPDMSRFDDVPTEQVKRMNQACQCLIPVGKYAEVLARKLGVSDAMSVATTILMASDEVNKKG